MRIGTVRTEEARVHDSMVGYHQFHAEETQEPFGSFEVFWHSGGPLGDDTSPDDAGEDWDHDDSEQCHDAGWYWWACFPGCMPDGDAIGPFATSRLAHQDADEWSPEYDDN